jgi:hypothetical protein
MDLGMKILLLNISYYLVIGFKYFYIGLSKFFKYFHLYTHNTFTWIYNKLSKYFGWEKRFYYLHEDTPNDTPLNKLKAFFKIKNRKKGTMATDYKQKYLKAKSQSDKNFSRYKYRKSQEHKYKDLHQQEKKRADDLQMKNTALLKQIQALKTAKSSNANNTGANTSNTPDSRTAMEIMGVTTGFTAKDLKDAYKRLTNRYHPDKHIHMSIIFRNEAEIEFGKIQNAYNKIK